MRKLFLAFIFSSLLLSTTVLAVSLPGDWWGKVRIEGMNNTNGAVVTAYLNNNSDPVATTTVGSLKSQYYLLHVPGEKRDNVSFKVNGFPVEQSIQEWSRGDHSRLDLSIKTPKDRKYSSSNLTLEANKSINIDARDQTNTTLDLKVKSNMSNVSVNITRYLKNPLKKEKEESGILSLEKYMGIEASSKIEVGMNWVIINVSYTDAEVSDKGVDEKTLRLHYFNETSEEWVAYNPPMEGVNTDENYVWANSTHFSIWGVFGKPPEEEEGTTGGGGGGMATLGTAANTTTTILQENVTTTTVPSEEETTTTIEEQTSEEETSPTGRFLANPATLGVIIVVLILIIVGVYLVKTGKIEI